VWRDRHDQPQGDSRLAQRERNRDAARGQLGTVQRSQLARASRGGRPLMRPQQGWSSRSGCAEAGRGGRDPRCPRERYRGIRPRYRQNFAEKILSNLFAYQKTALTPFRRLVALNPATSACRSRGALGELVARAAGRRVVAERRSYRRGMAGLDRPDRIEPPVAGGKPAGDHADRSGAGAERRPRRRRLRENRTPRPAVGTPWRLRTHY
jgi:hypothetical protein